METSTNTTNDSKSKRRRGKSRDSTRISPKKAKKISDKSSHQIVQASTSSLPDPAVDTTSGKRSDLAPGGNRNPEPCTEDVRKLQGNGKKVPTTTKNDSSPATIAQPVIPEALTTGQNLILEEKNHSSSPSELISTSENIQKYPDWQNLAIDYEEKNDHIIENKVNTLEPEIQLPTSSKTLKLSTNNEGGDQVFKKPYQRPCVNAIDSLDQCMNPIQGKLMANPSLKSSSKLIHYINHHHKQGEYHVQMDIWYSFKFEKKKSGQFIFGLVKSHPNHRKEPIFAPYAYTGSLTPISVLGAKRENATLVTAMAMDVMFHAVSLYLDHEDKVDILFKVRSSNVANNGLINESSNWCLVIIPLDFYTPTNYRVFDIPLRCLVRRFEMPIKIKAMLQTPTPNEQIIPYLTWPSTLDSIRRRLLEKFLDEILKLQADSLRDLMEQETLISI